MVGYDPTRVKVVRWCFTGVVHSVEKQPGVPGGPGVFWGSLVAQTKVYEENSQKGPFLIELIAIEVNQLRSS